ncbi:MAG: NfeD family protein [Pseudomonadota bacterium]
MPTRGRLLFSLMLAALAATAIGAPPPAKVAGALLLSIDGPIGPATDDYLERALAAAQELSPRVIILRLDTPGGLDTAMRAMIRRITASPIPIAAYVAPTGARAASAGTYILYASHIAAMAPGTNLGAATPVAIGGLPSGREPGGEEGEDEAPATGGTAMERKAINDAAAYIRGLAELRGRNADWAERAVRESVSLQASEALEQNVIDLIATDVDDLLARMDGRAVRVAAGEVTLQTAGLPVTELLPDWRSRLLGVLTNPNVAYLLMLAGIYGLLLEFYNPGGLIPGIVGAICLLLALYAFQMLPVNYAGIGLILLGIGFMIAEAFQPSFGMLGVGGVVAFVIGSIILMDTELPGFRIYLSVIATTAVVTALALAAIVGLALASRRRAVVSGADQLIGADAEVLEDFENGQGRVFVHSESWRGHCQAPLRRGQHARVTAVRGLTLELEPQGPGTAETPP